MRPSDGRPTPPLLELSDVTVVRGGRTALDRVNLRIEQGENVAILGPNGCGKSTLVKLIDRELYPLANGGWIRIFGRERWEVSALRSMLGVVSNDIQSAIPPEATAVEAVVAGFVGTLGVYYNEASRERVTTALGHLEQVAAGHLANRAVGSLSSGEARRVMIARALAHHPSTLLLDEPTTSLDLVSADGLLTTLRDLATLGKSIILVTHHLQEIVPEIQRVVLLKEGRVLKDGPRRDVMTSENLSEAFDAQIVFRDEWPYWAYVDRAPQHGLQTGELQTGGVR